jgi:hypothetical protein
MPSPSSRSSWASDAVSRRTDGFPTVVFDWRLFEMLKGLLDMPRPHLD